MRAILYDQFRCLWDDRYFSHPSTSRYYFCSTIFQIGHSFGDYFSTTLLFLILGCVNRWLPNKFEPKFMKSSSRVEGACQKLSFEYFIIFEFTIRKIQNMPRYLDVADKYFAFTSLTYLFKDFTCHADRWLLLQLDLRGLKSYRYSPAVC